MRNKNILISTILVLAFALSAGVNIGSAQTDTRTMTSDRVEERQERILGIIRLYQNQINRATKSVERLDKILERIKTQRAKLAGSATDLAAVDALVAKAETQGTEVDQTLEKIKAKASEIAATLTLIKADTTSRTETSSTNITKLKRQVQEYQTLVRDLKKKINAYHGTLKDVVKKMKEVARLAEKAKGDDDKDEDETTPAPTSSPTN